MDCNVDHTIAAIGPRVRELRRARHWTLAELAARTGLSISALSRLETGHRQPTLDLLLPLAAAFAIALDHLVSAPATGDARVHLSPRRSQSGGVIVPLTESPGNVRVFKQVLGPREVRMRSHAGHAWLYVLAGTLRLILDDVEHRVAPGETAEFSSLTPHWFGPADDRAVEILHLYGPRGERAVARIAAG
ncbi:helix-turn-helix domain-containing protein [Leucobacter musarum]|uniref:helix-turn-helix domain-containing protein n=1 Tax=Leucobacter musarum TaxID=1930747 RepID=UPI0006A759E7|nr:helix-turn-helix transcriptional regulator [Leucobacter musarum]